MNNDLGILKNLTSELVKRIVIIIQMTCVLFAVVIYYSFAERFMIFGPWILVVNLLTLVGLPSVFRKLNSDLKEDVLHFSGAAEQDESLSDIDLWDRAVVGFYIFTNVSIILILFVLLFM